MYLSHEDISWDHVELDEAKEGKHDLETHEGTIEKTRLIYYYVTAN